MPDISFRFSLAWSAFQTQTYDWWGTTVYKGCNHASRKQRTRVIVFFLISDSDCGVKEIEMYKDGLRTANFALITQVPQY